MSNFEEIMRDIGPIHIRASGAEQIRTAIAGLIVTATICGALTWIGWAIPAAVRWWS